MVPTEMLVIPWYVVAIDLHWTDSYWGIMFPGVMSAFGVFLMRQFFTGVPNDLIDAARLDGFSEFRIFWKIALPLVKPALAALCIFTFLGNWNAYIWPLIVTRSSEMRTLAGRHRLLFKRSEQRLSPRHGRRRAGHDPGARHFRHLPTPDHQGRGADRTQGITTDAIDRRAIPAS